MKDTHLIHDCQRRHAVLVFNVANLSRSVFVGRAWLPAALAIETSERETGGRHV